jgi:hypothetical protein
VAWVHGVVLVVQRPPVQVWPSGQQTDVPNPTAHSWVLLQLVPSGWAMLPLGQQMRAVVPPGRMTV